MLLLARRVIPVSAPPIEKGAVLIEEDRIAFVGPSPGACTGPVLDLGDSVLFPGLVNAHCHLEFHISPSPPLTLNGGTFAGWVRSTVEASRDTSHLQARIDSLLRGGTTTVADHVGPETPLIDTTPLRRIPFWEVLGADQKRARESLLKAQDRAGREGGFVTPHSLYAVHGEILEIFGTSLQSIHILESSDEDRFFRRQSGPLADLVRERGGVLPFPVSSPVQWLAAKHRLGPDLLLVHGNYLDLREMDLLQEKRAGVIHCPGSHRFFGHRRFPLPELGKRGIPVALGTDSLAGNEALSMLREMRIVKENYSEMRGDEILKMATIEGARALKMDDQIGTLEVGKKADLAAVRGDLFQASEVSFLMIDGQKIICTNP